MSQLYVHDGKKTECHFTDYKLKKQTKFVRIKFIMIVIYLHYTHAHLYSI